jgi:hypothetical protein
MGQQQLLLIVLGVIIVGIAVVVGINVFTASSSQANNDAVIADLTNLASLAQQYYRKPTALGGGGNSFASFAIPGALDTTGNGIYTISTAGSATGISFQGVGNENGTKNASSKVTVTMAVTPTKITSTIVN